MIIRRLTNKTQITEAINFNKLPVVAIDIAKDGIESCGKIVGFSTPVRVPFNTRQEETLYIHATLSWFEDDQTFKVSNNGCMIHASFGYSDIAEMLRYANAPIIDKDTTFVLVIHNSQTMKALAPIVMNTTSWKDIHCNTILTTGEKITFNELF